ncbi:MAG TPA: double zinc ribbon domain-containing protein [Pyrinomonadaceae bacterium]|jgi:ComF family protein
MMRSFSGAVRDAALSVLYPRDCEACGSLVESQVDGAACAACWSKTRIFSSDDTLCRKCGALLNEAAREEKPAEDVLCRRCAQESFSAARAVGAYEGALRASVIALKREPFVSTRLATLLYQAALQPPLNCATRIIPVPLHPGRLRERGFNQAAELGRSLSLLTGLAIDEASLTRTRYTERHRALMDERARRESVHDSFQVLRPRLVEGEHILLVDDIYTTGATASACAAALLEAGASSVCALTVARPI